MQELFRISGANYQDLETVLKGIFEVSINNPVSKNIYNEIRLRLKNPNHFGISDFILEMSAFLKEKVKYVKDSSLQQNVYSPEAFLKIGTGDCKTYTMFGAVMSYFLGFQNIYGCLVGYRDHKRTYSHIFNQSGKTYFDLTSKNVLKPNVIDIVRLKPIELL